MKPIFRWTIGNCAPAGYACLFRSLKTMLKLYGEEFDYYICHNNCNQQIIRELVGQRPITLIKQIWDDCPLPLDYDANQACWGGSSLWKLCPPRLNIETHEIVCDNDIVFVSRCKEIEDFLKSDKVLLNMDPIKYQGHYRDLFQAGERYNAGFFGMPPGYDFASQLVSSWEATGRHQQMNQADEQGLTSYTLKQQPAILLEPRRIPLVFTGGNPINVIYDPEKAKNHFEQKPFQYAGQQAVGYHFVTVNKNGSHEHWQKFESYCKRNKVI